MTTLDALHPDAEVRLVRLDDGVVVGVHQAAGVLEPAELEAHPTYPREVRTPIAGVFDDSPSSVPLRDDVVNRTCFFLAGSSHVGYES